MIRIGDQGPSVTALQDELRTLGYYGAPLDGMFGQLTKDAVLAFQAEFQLEADGLVGQATRQMLDRLRERDVTPHDRA